MPLLSGTCELVEQKCNRIRQNDRGHSHDTVIRVYDSAGNVIKTHEHNVYPNGIVKYIKVKNDQNPS
jgi:hypothetical protein